MAIEDIPPTTLKPAPAMVACEIVTAAVPVLDRVKVCGLVDPSATFPKLRLVALAASVPEEAEVDPDFVTGVPAPVRPTQPASDSNARHEKISAKRLSGAR